jgi:hypothetical protein
MATAAISSGASASSEPEHERQHHQSERRPDQRQTDDPGRPAPALVAQRSDPGDLQPCARRQRGLHRGGHLIALVGEVERPRPSRREQQPDRGRTVVDQQPGLAGVAVPRRGAINRAGGRVERALKLWSARGERAPRRQRDDCDQRRLATAAVYPRDRDVRLVSSLYGAHV